MVFIAATILHDFPIQLQQRESSFQLFITTSTPPSERVNASRKIAKVSICRKKVMTVRESLQCSS